MSNFEDLKVIEQQLSSQLTEVRKELRKIRLAAVERETGYAVGKVVESHGKRYEVSNFKGSSTLSVYGFPIKKDGEPSKREVFIDCISVPKEFR